MQITIFSVGKLKKGPETEIFNRYQSLAEGVGRNIHLTPLHLVEFPESKLKDVEARRLSEAENISKKLNEDSYVIALDEFGKKLTSVDFSKSIQKTRDSGVPSVSFIIGGPDGLSSDIKQKANLLLSLSGFTLPHGLARIILCEQIYRAMTIITGHPYHRV